MSPVVGADYFPGPVVGSGRPYRSFGAKTPDYVHIQPTPAANATLAAAPAPEPLSNPPASISDRVLQELGHEADIRMPRRSRGKTRAMRYSHHTMGLMSHAALAQQRGTREIFDETFREHALPKPEADLPTASASDLPTPSIVAKGVASEHAEIWRGSMAREFSGLLLAHTFGPA